MGQFFVVAAAIRVSGLPGGRALFAAGGQQYGERYLWFESL
jgi:hypothetical protein